MIRFLVKMSLWVALLAGGSVLAVNTIPSLKANIIETVNPRVKEQKLVRELQKSLDALADSAVIAKNKAAITKSQELLQQISELNGEHAGLVDSIISKVADVMLGTATTSTPTPVPQTTPTSAPCR